ncbi:hypothetical protein JJC00_35430 [Bradyrhizobium diazoefficiens]|uniref:hypothetical protein n=1 Tax=Bradyrhizobium diazoefficiens TaxID=1355477 RepID=UPI00190B18D3|nr:hypothetical protein [Bradyrhizobium diazoefficiens]QQO33729.1 hypothetical protein JJC00_35430 [Bradyrhizobium diazoefficiens]
MWRQEQCESHDRHAFQFTAINALVAGRYYTDEDTRIAAKAAVEARNALPRFVENYAYLGAIRR